MKNRSFFARYAPAILVAIGLLTPVMIYAAYRTIQSNTNKVQDWLPATFVETGDLAWFRRHFAGDQFVIISWDGCRLGGNPSQPNAEPDDPRIEQFAQALAPEFNLLSADRSPPPSGEAPPHKHYFKSVTTPRQLLTFLTSPPMDVPYDIAVRRLQGLLIGPDGHQASLVVTLTDEAVNNFRGVLGRGDGGWLRFHRKPGVLFELLRKCHIDTATVHLGGPPVDNVSIDEEGERTLVRLAFLSGLLGLILSWWSLRSIKLTLIVFACGLLSAAASLAAVWLTGETADAILMSMPSLIYVLGISGAVHLINYYRDEVTERGYAGAPERALRHGWKPALLCSVTTAFGLLSLCTSDLTPIRKFGLYSAVGMMLMLVFLFVYLPAALQIWPTGMAVPTDAARRAKVKNRRKSLLPGQIHRFWSVDDFWQRFGGWIIRRHALVTFSCVAFIAVVSLGVGRIRTSIDLLKLFDGEARILQDYRWLEANVGRLVPMEIVVHFQGGSLGHGESGGNKEPMSFLDRMQVVSDIQNVIENRFGTGKNGTIGPTVSAVTFVPPLPPKHHGASSIVRRKVTNSRLAQSYDGLLRTGYLAVDPEDGSELWRISLRVAAFQDIDYGRFSDDVRATVDPIVAGYNKTNASATSPRLSAVFTGVVPIVYKAQRALLQSLVQSTIWSFLTITPLLMLVARSFSGGIVAMLPNVLPVLVVFGGMGWTNWRVDIGSMMAASIALGVAVDDTIHYLTWFRDDLKRSSDRNQAILAAYRRCATPTAQAALINGLGLSIFAVSTFVPTRQFGILMLTILLTGGVAELILLPALLAGPLGRAFQWKRRSWWSRRDLDLPQVVSAGEELATQGEFSVVPSPVTARHTVSSTQA